MHINIYVERRARSAEDKKGGEYYDHFPFVLLIVSVVAREPWVSMASRSPGQSQHRQP